jgi:peroxiredoxin
MTPRSLTEELAALRISVGEPWETLNSALVRRLIEAKSTERALKAGDKCPEFGMMSADGKLVRSSELLSQGPLVLSFYRGVWCPFCSAELEALHAAEPAIRAAGGKLVAISPEVGGTPAKVALERGFKFDILGDLENGVALAFGLVFRVADEMIEAFVRDGDDFPLFYGNNSWFLPIPATYIIARDGTITHAYVDPEFRTRLDPSTIVRELQKLK